MSYKPITQNSKLRISLTALVLWGSFCFLPLNISAKNIQQQKVARDSVTISTEKPTTKKEKGLKGLLQKVKTVKPLGWLLRNWSVLPLQTSLLTKIMTS